MNEEIKCVSDDLQDRINAMIPKLIEVLQQDSVTIGASAMMSLLINNVLDSGVTYQDFINDMTTAWNHYVEENKKASLDERS